jgi:pseudoazurin
MLKLFLALFLSCFSLLASAKEYRVEMLNKSDGQSMVFKPMFLKVSVGDVITFVPTSKGHTSQSVFTPKEASTWKGKTSKIITVTLNKEGVYIYKCQNHGMMGMAGIIQVSSPKNLKESKEYFKNFKNTFIMNKDRLDKFLNEIKD